MELANIETFILAVLLCFGPPAHQQADPPPASSQLDLTSPAQTQTAQTPEPTPDPVPGPTGTKLYILMYHDVVKDGAKCGTWTITTGRLREDFQWLSDHGYATLLPSEVVQRVKNGTLPKKAVLVTFDDGYASNLELALPILEETHTKAVVSVVTGFIDSEEPGFMTWDMCRELNASPLVEIGSHTHALHENGCGIKRLKGESKEDYAMRVLRDIQISIYLLESRLGSKPRFLAYPYGITDSWAKDFLRENFDMTVTTNHGVVNTSKGLYDLNRYNINMKYPPSKYLPQ